jgi:hypothetical protein
MPADARVRNSIHSLLISSFTLFSSNTPFCSFHGWVTLPDVSSPFCCPNSCKCVFTGYFLSHTQTEKSCTDVIRGFSNLLLFSSNHLRLLLDCRVSDIAAEANVSRSSRKKAYIVSQSSLVLLTQTVNQLWNKTGVRIGDMRGSKLFDKDVTAFCCPNTADSFPVSLCPSSLAVHRHHERHHWCRLFLKSFTKQGTKGETCRLTGCFR